MVALRARIHARSCVPLETHMASRDAWADTGDVPSWGSVSYLFGPLVSMACLGVLILLMRWAFSGRSRSLVQRRPRIGSPEEYGLLVRVAAPATFVEAEMIKLTLTDAGLRCTLAPTEEGPAVMVFPEDVDAARQLLEATA